MFVKHSSETHYFSMLSTLMSTDVTRLGGAGSLRVIALLIHGFMCSDVCLYVHLEAISYLIFYFMIFCIGNPGSDFYFGEGNVIGRLDP